MERVPCEPTPECRLYPSCFEDVHHIYKRSLADTTLKQVFSDLDENKRRNCRDFHMRDEAENGWPEYPESPIMLRRITEAARESRVNLSRSKRRKLGI